MWGIYSHIKAEINFVPLLQEYIPTVAILCNKGIRARHWEQMSNIAGFDLTPDSGSTLRKVLKLNLGPYMDQFEGISAAASKVSLTAHQMAGYRGF